MSAIVVLSYPGSARDGNPNGSAAGAAGGYKTIGARITVDDVAGHLTGLSCDVAALSADISVLARSDDESRYVFIEQVAGEALPPRGTVSTNQAVSTSQATSTTQAASATAGGVSTGAATKVFKITNKASALCSNFWVIIGPKKSLVEPFNQSKVETATKLREQNAKREFAVLDLAIGDEYVFKVTRDYEKEPRKYFHKVGPKGNGGVSGRNPGTVVAFTMTGVEKLVDTLHLVDIKPYTLPGKFFQFKKLPKEVQAIVWNEAAEGRKLSAHEITILVRNPMNPYNPCYSTTTHIFRGEWMPRVAYVSKDVLDHLVSRGNYERRFQTREGGLGVWFNREVDYVHLLPQQAFGRLGSFFVKPTGLFRKSLVDEDDAWSITKLAFDLETFEAFRRWAMDNVRDLPDVEELLIIGRTIARIPKKFVMRIDFYDEGQSNFTVKYKKADGEWAWGWKAIEAAFEELDDEHANGQKARMVALARDLRDEHLVGQGYPERVSAIIEFYPCPAGRPPPPGF